MPENTDEKIIKPEETEEYDAVSEAPAGRTAAALILGIASIVLCPLPFMLIAAVVGLWLERESERTGYNSLQKPAKILCIIGIVMCALAIAALALMIFVLGVISR